MRELALFAGAGGGLLASTWLLGWDTVAACEIDPYCRSVLLQRQRDGLLPYFPIWDDIRTFDGRPWRGAIDVISGGFPCQDISSAGSRRGLDGARSGLWFEMLRVIGEVRPAYVFAENSPNLRSNGLVTVLQGLAGLGFDACWGVLGAWHVGAPHRRNRMWIVASHADRCRERGFPYHAEMASASAAGGDAADADCERNGSPQYEPPGAGADESAARQLAADTNSDPLWQQPGRCCGQDGQAQTELGGSDQTRWLAEQARQPSCGDWWSVHRFAGVDDGVADGVGERVKATGNGQVPRVAALAWRVLRDTLDTAQAGLR